MKLIKLLENIANEIESLGFTFAHYDPYWKYEYYTSNENPDYYIAYHRPTETVATYFMNNPKTFDPAHDTISNEWEKYTKDFKPNKDIEEADTSSYPPPKFVSKPAKDDTGYAITRKHYHRFIWTVPTLGKDSIDKGETSLISEGEFDDDSGFDTHDWDAQSPDEISGMGSPVTYPAGDAPNGYIKNDQGTDYLPTDMYIDPDKEKAIRLSHINKFAEFIKRNG